jgi:hypothetical protein
VCGDLNIRVGLKPDLIRHDNVNESFDDQDYIPESKSDRASFDTTCNSFGLRLLDVCKSFCVSIVNGRIGNDQGLLTYVSRNGASVVDYLLCKELF